jgi:alanyl-tRNA synthetase
LCGGTHVPETGVIGTFLIRNEGSAAAGIRRIEALTGRTALELIQKRRRTVREAASQLGVPQREVLPKLENMLSELENLSQDLEKLRRRQAISEFDNLEPASIEGVTLLSASIPEVGQETLRLLADRFRQKHPSGVLVLGSVVENRPVLIAAVTEDLVARGLHANVLVDAVAKQVGGGGGGKPTLAQAGGKDPEKLSLALETVPRLIEAQLK